MNNEEKLKLYWEAKEAYYNGEPIMEDLEFDQLEKELGLENKSAVGAKHNPSYTIKHPFIMGSLSKVQIHEKDGSVDWESFAEEIAKYVFKNYAQSVLASPKYDGCSFEVVVNDGEVTSISTRGDGEYGKDLKKHLINKVQPNVDAFNTQINFDYILRGEVLVDKLIAAASDFVNPRSFVSGILNRDYCEDEEFLNMLNCLDIVIYDVRVNEEDGWVDKDWDRYNYPSKPKYSLIVDKGNLKGHGLGYIYKRFNEYRHTCKFALDGIVLKPTQEYRENNLTEQRPKDCVAVKFIPMLQETEVINITWQLAKTGEMTPIIWVNPVEMDGKMVQKCSGSNYGNLISKKVSIGSKIIMSLAGDIIPFLYKVTDTEKFSEDNLNIPENTYIQDDIHLMKKLTKKEYAKNSFVNSVKSLNINNIGPEIAAKIFDYMTEEDETTAEFFGDTPKELPWNILELTPEDVYYGAGGGKTGNNVKKAFSDLLKNISLKDIIASCSFKFCGPKVAEQCASYLINGEADFEHLAKEGYEWVMSERSFNRMYLDTILEKLGMNIETFKERFVDEVKSASNQIPIIMTGEPTTCSTKAEFLRLHPEYRNTTSWKEVQIVFTNSMDSNTGKMKKAREKGIEIRLY